MRAQFVLSEIGVGLRRNLTMTFAVIVSVALSLALFGGSLLMREQVSTMKGYWYDKVNVSIFLCNKSDARVRPQLRQGRGHRASRRSRSRPTSRRWTSSRPSTTSRPTRRTSTTRSSSATPRWPSTITPDQMQESFRVKLKDPEKYKVVATAFAGRDGVQSVQDQKQHPGQPLRPAERHELRRARA